MRYLSVFLLVSVISQAALAELTCEGLFSAAQPRDASPPRISFWDRVRNFRIQRRDLNAQTAFLNHIAKAKSKRETENALIGETLDGKFRPRGWANFISLDPLMGTAQVRFEGEPQAVSLADIFVFKDFGDLKASRTFVHQRQDLRGQNSESPPVLYFVYGFSPNGLVLVERLGPEPGRKSPKGFDVFPIEELVVDKSRR